MGVLWGSRGVIYVEILWPFWPSSQPRLVRTLLRFRQNSAKVQAVPYSGLYPWKQVLPSPPRLASPSKLSFFCLYCNTRRTCPAHSAQHMLQEIKSFHYFQWLKFGYFRRIKPTYWASLQSSGKDSHCHSRIDIYSTPSLLISIVVMNPRGKHASLSFLLHHM